jgi:hypothetical protein
MSYGELHIELGWTGRNRVNGRFLKGHVPANKGKKWNEFMPKRSQKRSAKGWSNLDKNRVRPATAGRPKKPVIALTDDGDFIYFPFVGAAAKWCGGLRENVARCCRQNETTANTDHKYLGYRFYFEEGSVWLDKIKK